MNKKLFLFAILFVATAFSACNKFEQGPSLSLKTKNKRLIGYWQTSEKGYYKTYYINNYSNSPQKDSVFVKEKNIYHFRKDGNMSNMSGEFHIPNKTYHQGTDSITINDTLFIYNSIDMNNNNDYYDYAKNNEGYATGNWKWAKNKISLILSYYVNDSIRWDILMLTPDELRAEKDPDRLIRLFKCEVVIPQSKIFPFK